MNNLRVASPLPEFPVFTYTNDSNSIANYSSHIQEGNCIVVNSNDGYRVKVVVCKPDVVRIVLSSSIGKFDPDMSYAVVKYDWPTVFYTLDNRKKDLIIITDELYIRVIKNPIRFEFYNRNGDLLSRDKDGLRKTAYSINGERISKLCEKALDASEHFYGLGERSHDSLDLRGKFIHNWNVGTGQIYNGEDKMGYGTIPFVLSTKGYGIYLDNSSRSVFDLGNGSISKYYFGISAGEMDYYFILGPTFKNIINNYTLITGRPFLPPKYMCGYQSCKWAYETQEEVESILEGFRSRNIPCDVIWLDGPDRGWWKNNVNFCSTFDSRYPDPQGMINNLHNNGFKVGLLENVQNQTGGDQYQVGVTNKYYIAKDSAGTPWMMNDYGSDSSEVDFRRPGAADWWGSLHESLWHMGSDAWWNEMNDGEFGEGSGGHEDKYYFNTLTAKWDLKGLLEHNATSLLSCQALYEYQKKYFKNNAMDKRSWMFSRGKYAGLQRCSWTWSADADWNLQDGWDLLRRQMRWESNMGLGAIVYGSDLGGSGGPAGEQSYLRWVQMEIFNFFTRNHSGGEGKEPWLFLSVEAHIKKWIEWKYTMMPYIYTGAYDMSQNGSPIHRPLVYEFTDDSSVYNMEDEFMFGDWLLVAPVLNGTDANTSDLSRNVYLPMGIWIDYKDGQTTYTGGATLEDYYADLDTVPIFVKAGAIIPMQAVMQYIGEKPVDLILLDTYPSGNSSYTMYEDDGNTYNYETGAWMKTKFSCATDGSKVTFTIHPKQSGGGSFTPEARDYLLKVHTDFGNIASVNLNDVVLPSKTFNELKAGQSGWCQDIGNKLVYVRVYDNGAKNTIQINS